LVVAADCKGVPLVRADLAASATPPAPAVSRPRGHHRRGKGEKANKKRMAAVGAVYTIEPFPRTADDIIDELDRREAARRRPRPRNSPWGAGWRVGGAALFLGRAGGAREGGRARERGRGWSPPPAALLPDHPPVRTRRTAPARPPRNPERIAGRAGCPP